MNRIALALALAAALAGCQSPARDSGVIAISPDVFALTHEAVPNFYTMGFLRSFALTDAVEHCKSLNKPMRVIDEKETESPPGSNTYRRFDLTFACD
ncbi:MAG: hypothetical protein Q8R02_18075 [Hyphomonadaceae bacterium]|nr:hypothetical protein [Hyphomonadaceae bacterium]